MPNQKSAHKHTPFITTATVLVVSLSIWVNGLMNSPVLDPELRAEKRFVQSRIRELSIDSREQRQLARAYWQRYEDVRTDAYFGENGPNGIYGARDHFTLHGKREGRIYGPIPVVTDLEQEKPLAESYWHRYPEVAQSSIWGRNSTLGILGPRDHYRYVGKYMGYTWGN